MSASGANITSACSTLTVQEAATELGVSGARVRMLIAEKRLVARKHGRLHLIEREALESVRVRPLGRPRKQPDAMTRGDAAEQKKKPAAV